ncbi:MAG: hypothetical protein EAY65_00305 [Alphaproteobacteria bacterium]|nr:MAG: hypothetical protein EAY65_00305 [Alphaproteobacteria bacterium]
MFKLLDDAALLAQRAAMFITGRGASMTAVVIASQFVTEGAANIAPMVGLAVGMPITAAMSTMTHYVREKAILNDFRKELSAYFDIAPADVTLDHLRSLAYGNQERGIEPQPFFQEVLKRNDKNRILEIGSNFAAAALTMGMVTQVLAMGIFKEGMLAGALAVGGLQVAIPLAIASGVAMFCMNQLFNTVGHQMFSDKGRTGYEKLESLSIDVDKQRDVTPMQVMGVVANTHPDISHALAQHYNGAKFDLLLPADQKKLFEQFEPQIHFSELADKINRGAMAPTELGFIASGTSSGRIIDDADVGRPAHRGLRAELGAIKQHAINHMEDHARARKVMREGFVPDRFDDANESMPPVIEGVPEQIIRSFNEPGMKNAIMPSPVLQEHSIHYEHKLVPSHSVARPEKGSDTDSTRAFVERIQKGSPDCAISLA